MRGDIPIPAALRDSIRSLRRLIGARADGATAETADYPGKRARALSRGANAGTRTGSPPGHCARSARHCSRRRRCSCGRWRWPLVRTSRRRRGWPARSPSSRGRAASCTPSSACACRAGRGRRGWRSIRRWARRSPSRPRCWWLRSSAAGGGVHRAALPLGLVLRGLDGRVHGGVPGLAAGGGAAGAVERAAAATAALVAQHAHLMVVVLGSALLCGILVLVAIFSSATRWRCCPCSFSSSC